MLSQLVLVVALTVHGALSLPTKACAPDQWSAKYFGKIAMDYKGKPMVATVSGMRSTDYMKQMESFNQTTMVNGQAMMMNVITDFNKGMLYEVFPNEQRCTAASLRTTTKLKKYCEGDADLKVLGKLSLGGKMATMYEFPKMFAKNISSARLTVLDGVLTPVTELIEQNLFNIPQIIAFQYGNATPMVSDPHVFNVPSYCMSPVKVTQTVPNPLPAAPKAPKLKRVCAPDQFEAVGLGVLAEQVRGKDLVFDINLKMARDYKNKMEATVTDLVYAGHPFRSVSITDWSMKKVFIVNPAKQTCTVLPTPTVNMVQMCSDSADMKWISSMHIDGIMVDLYTHDSTTRKEHTTFTVFRDSFELISSTVETVVNSIPQMTAIQFGNMTMGISDPKIFTIPDYCDKDVEGNVVG